MLSLTYIKYAPVRLLTQRHTAEQFDCDFDLNISCWKLHISCEHSKQNCEDNCNVCIIS